jgi:S-DNA-T family DNA segregation ATPase FtsK/SpoIIIE
MTNFIKNQLKSENYKFYKKEITCIALATIFIFLSISLISYNAQDNSLFHFSNKNQYTANWCGVLGANFSSLLFYLFNHAAYLFLIALAGVITFLFKGKNFTQARSKIVATVALFTCVTTLMSILETEFDVAVSGGIIGNWLAYIFQPIFGQQGSTLLLITTSWISVNYLLEISMLPIIKYLFLVLWTLVSTGFKKFLRIISFRTKNSTIKSGASVCKEPDPEIEYWKNLLEKGVIKNETAHNQKQAQNRFEYKKINKQTQKIKFKNYELIRLANTVLSKSIFAKQDNGICVHDAILETASKYKKDGVAFVLPDLQIFLSKSQDPQSEKQKEENRACSKKLEEKLLFLGVKGTVSGINPGPVITMFEYKPEIDSKISKITAVEDDLAMALTAKSIRILAPIPGKNVVGFEISNPTRQDIFFGDIAKSSEFEKFKGTLPLIFGVDVIGKPIIEDLYKMPHLLVGGATGAGKSVGLNTMIVSLLCKLNPSQLKLILIDPKRLEFGAYADIPHLLFPIVTNATTAVHTLKWTVQEMESRYQKMAQVGVRNINEYNGLQDTEPLPFIVVVIDELADLMMVAGKDVETQIVRIAQMARAAGINMIVATQRPSVEVVTGLIKVNFPSRISFRVSSKIDSRTVLDSPGAEKLLGRGDMLFMSSSAPDSTRVHGAYVSDQEIQKVVDWWRMQQEPNYLNLNEALNVAESNNKFQDLDDELYSQVLEFLKTTDEISISLIQRYFRIGFNRSARLIEKLEIDGMIAPAQGGKTRKVIRS